VNLCTGLIMRPFRCAALAAVAVIGFASVANAADMPAKGVWYTRELFFATSGGLGGNTEGFSMKKFFGIVAVLALSVMFSAASATAATLAYDANLTADGESSSTGTGFALVTIDTVTNMMTVNVTFSGLTTGTTASHIHCCTATAGTGTAGVATTTPTFTGFPLGVTSGSYLHTFDLTLASSYNPAFVTAEGSVAAAEAALLAGLATDVAYLNIHTTMFPGGEILGFLVPTPLPAALPLFATGLGALGLLGWRRKRKAVTA
jgi:CHRD domain